MAIERENLEAGSLDLNEEGSVEGQDEDALAEARAREAELTKQLNEAAIRAARAEGEADALKRGVKSEPAPTPVISDAQWAELEQAHGKTRQQILADAQLTRATADEAVKPIKAMLADAQREAAEAKEEAKRAKASTSLYAVQREFFEKNPGLTGHRGEIDAYLAKWPEAMREDPKKLEELLADAKTFVRGKLREEKGSGPRTARAEAQTERVELDVELDDEPSQDEARVDLDLRDLNKGSRRLIEDIARMPGGEDLSDAPPALDELSITKAYELCERHDGRGVDIDDRGEFARGKRLAEGSLRDPSRTLATSDRDRQRRGDLTARRK